MKPIFRITAFLLSLILVFTSSFFSVNAEEATEGEPESAVVTTTTTTTTQPTTEKTTRETEKKTTKPNKKNEKKEAKKSLKEQRDELKKRLADSENKLKQFSADAKETEGYIDALDEKIGYLNEELNLLDAEVNEAQKKVDELEKQIAPLEKETKELQKQYDKSKKEYDGLRESFNSTYDAYCMRLRALYISGNSSVFAALLTSDGLSQFLSRLEMIRTVAKSDTALLKKVNSQMDKIVTEQNGLEARKSEIGKVTGVLEAKRNELKAQQDKVLEKQSEIAQKKVKIAEDRAESDRLFAEYARKAQIYTEFRNEDEELIKQVDSEIDALLNGLKDPSEITTAKNKKQDPNSVKGDYKGSGELFSGSNAALSLCYPAPGHTAVSQVFGHYRNGKAHTGIDYPVPMGSKIVAAQKGIVITVKRLNYSYGYYVMIYHGTDAKGRKVVTLYAHNSSILVSNGQTVRKGQEIAKSGSTGNSTGPHCHFEVILDGVKVNPKNYVG